MEGTETASTTLGNALERLRAGERARRIARALNLPLGRVYLIALQHGIELKRGADRLSPEESTARFDKQYWPGAAAYLLERVPEIGLTKIGSEFGRTRQWAHQKFYRLGGKKYVPVNRKGILLRPDVTPQKISELARRCRSIKEIARKLRCSTDTVRLRARKHQIQLPDLHQPKRPDITLEKVRQAARSCRSIRAMQKKLKTSLSTIYARALSQQIALPDGRTQITADEIRRARRYAREGYSVRKIAASLKRSRHTVAEWNRRYRLGLTVRHYPNRSRLNRDELERVRQYAQEGHTAQEVAAILNKHRSTIYTWNRKYRLGIPVQRFRRLAKPVVRG
jgi:transposase